MVVNLLGTLKYLNLATTYEVDDSFDSDKFIKLRLRVCHDGTNPNGTSFIVDVMDDAKESIKNIPLLAHVVFDENGQPQFGAHDMHIEEDKVNDGEYRIIYDEQPIGVIPETNNYEIAEYNGRNYVFVDCYCWRDYSNYAEVIIERDKTINLSMEIYVDEYRYNNQTKIYEILKYRYKGITLLGNSVGTGMIEAKAITEEFSLKNSDKFNEMMTELNEELSKHSNHSLDSSCMTFSNKKEDNELDEKLAILAKYNLKPEDLDFSIEDIEANDLEVKIKDFVEKSSNNPQSTFAATYNQKRRALQNALKDTYIKDTDGNIVEAICYYLMDFTNEYVFVEKAHLNENGDLNESYGRFSYTFDDANFTATITGDFEQMYIMWLTAEEKQEIENARNTAKEFEEYKKTHTVNDEEYAELKKYKEEKEKAEREAAEAELFEKFEMLKDNDEFIELKKNASQYDLNTLAEKCYAILGKTTANFSLSGNKQRKFVKFNIRLNEDDKSDNNNPYEELIEKYKKID